MFVLLTDFGVFDPYQAQLKAVIYSRIPNATIIDLFSNLDSCNIQSAAYLIPAYVNEFPSGSIFICVVDPGVGGEREPVMLKLDEQWFVGPDNGLFEILWRRASQREIFEIKWKPEALSNSFHGRDLFVPVACELFQNRVPVHTQLIGPNNAAKGWSDELFKIIYIDHFGNAISGVRASFISINSILILNQHEIVYAGTFCEVRKGELFWYCNSNGLIEIAVNQGSAEKDLGICCGDKFLVRE